MKKVQKFTASCVYEETMGELVPCVKLNFQVHKNDCPPRVGVQRVTVYRREEPDFVLGDDEAEYFEGLTPSVDDIIFSGEIDVLNTFSVYTDRDVTVGKVYAYWVGGERPLELLSSPRPIKVRDPYIWWSFDTILKETHALEKYDGVTVKKMGKSVLGRPLNAIFVGNRENCIACVGAVHAGESGPEILLRALKELLENEPEIFEKCGIAVMPVVNADMREAMVCGEPWYNRLNAVGVDLNRNFDASWEVVDVSYNLSSDDERSPTYRGACPSSEPETEAVVELLREAKPRAVFSYHYMSSITGDRLLCSASASENKEYCETAAAISREYSDAFRCGMGEVRAKNTDVVYACTGGSLPCYAYEKYGVPAFDLETSLFDLLEMKARCTSDKTTRDDLDKTVNGHTSAIRRMLELFS